MSDVNRAHRAAGSVVMLVAVLAGCAGERPNPVEPGQPQFARGGTGPTVSSADPAWGKQGEAGKLVAVIGSGFLPGDQAIWQLNGVPAPDITVRSTAYVSSTRLVATIDIAPTAPLTFYDIAVTSTGRKGGIGSLKFEVTTATPLPTLSGSGPVSTAFGISDAGLMVGQTNGFAAVWTLAGVESLGAGRALDVDAAGLTIVGSTNPSGDGVPMKWTGSPGAWTATPLSSACVAGATGGATARAVSADGLMAGGHVTTVIRHKNQTRPVLWDLATGLCQELPMPAGFSDYARINDVSGTGRVVGMAIGTSNVAAIWTAGIPAVLPLLAGTTGSDAEGISRDGTIVVGSSGTKPVYWVWNGSAWSGATELLTGACSGSGWANDVTDGGVIVGKGCDGDPWRWRLGGLGTTAERLGGLGTHTGGAGEAQRNGSFTTGPTAVGAASGSAVYWSR